MARQTGDGLTATIQSRLAERIARDPQGRALAFYTRDGNFEWRSAAEVWADAAGAAEVLRSHGLTAGGVCVIVLPSGELSARLLLATFLTGAVPLLVAPPTMFDVEHLTAVLERAVRRTAAQVVIHPAARPGDRERLSRGGRTKVVTDESALASSPASVLPPLPAGSDPAGLQLTSGTTGMPRICSWSQPAVLAAVDTMVSAMRLSPRDVFLNWTPLYHDMGLVNNFLTCMLSGVPLVMMSPQDFVADPAIWLRALSDTHATVTWSPNFGFTLAAERVRDEALEGVDLSEVRGFWNAAERIHYDTMQRFHERFSPYGVRWDALKTNFGCAENIGGATFSDPDGPLVVEHLDPAALHGRRVARLMPSDNPEALPVVSAGRPTPPTRVAILSRTGRELPDARVGEIALDTPSRMSGYLGDARATRRAFRGSLLRTGDLGYTRDGEMFWVGRVRERITVRARKFDPSDLEPVLFGIAGLREGCFAAFGVASSEAGTEELVVVSEVRRPLAAPTDELVGRVRKALVARLGVQASEVMLVEPGTLTKTSSGKRRHRHVRERFVSGALEAFRVRDEA